MPCTHKTLHGCLHRLLFATSYPPSFLLLLIILNLVIPSSMGMYLFILLHSRSFLNARLRDSRQRKHWNKGQEAGNGSRSSYLLMYFCPHIHLDTPAHPASEDFLLPAGGTDHLHYLTAPCFLRPRSWHHMTVCAYSPVSLLLLSQRIRDSSSVSVSWVSLWPEMGTYIFLRGCLDCWLDKLV